MQSTHSGDLTTEFQSTATALRNFLQTASLHFMEPMGRLCQPATTTASWTLPIYLKCYEVLFYPHDSFLWAVKSYVENWIDHCPLCAVTAEWD